MPFTCKIYIILILLIISVFTGCKDSQLDNAPDSDLVVKVSGTATPPLEWTNPKILAVYPKFDRPFDTAILANISNGKWEIFVEKNSDVKFYIINDINNNGSFDYLTEPRIPHSNNPIIITNIDSDVGDIVVCELTTDIIYPADWTMPLAFIMKGNNIMSYSDISDGVATLYAGSGTDYYVYVYNDNGDGYYDYLTETSYKYDGNPIDTSAGNITLNDINIIKVSGTITYTTSLEDNYSDLIDNLKAALVYPLTYATIESYGTVAGDGTYTVYGNARSKYRLWIFNDLDNDGTWNNYEPYVQIPERGSIAFADDAFIDISSGEMIIDTILGVLEGSIDVTGTTWTNPQAGLYQGWDVTAYNTIDSLEFSFMGVQTYSIDGAANIDQRYYILRYDDDNPHDGIFVYDDESDGGTELKTGLTDYKPDATGLAPTTTTAW